MAFETFYLLRFSFMNDYSKQHKKAWEFDAYNFWVEHAGTPEERAR